MFNKYLKNYYFELKYLLIKIKFDIWLLYHMFDGTTCSALINTNNLSISYSKAILMQ